MVFDSVSFLFFLPLAVVAHWLTRGHLRAALMLLASYVFYGSWDWRFLSLIVVSTLVDFVAAIRIEQARESGKATKPFVLASLVTNLGILGVFKYTGFFVQSLADLLGALGVDADLPTLNIVLPVGISFYTFQTLAYTIDVYRGKLAAERRLLYFALFVAWFPQLVAGPIERASRLLPQLSAKRRFDAQLFSDGLLLILWGLFKKMVVADNAALIVNSGFDFAAGGPLTAAEAYLATAAFALQIYGDFSGYSDMARGTSKLFGVELLINFWHPYLATGPSDFWRRWHISLSQWLRDYLYIPLGGSRTGGVSRNLMLTMLLGGLWHGAAWNFVLWGAYHGTLLVAERKLNPERLKVLASPRSFRATNCRPCFFPYS